MSLLRPWSLLLVMGAALGPGGCFVKSTCYNDADCSGGRYCCESEGICLEVGECCDGDDCPAGEGCLTSATGTGHGTCRPECRRDDQCDADEICDQVAGDVVGICSPPECAEDADCPSERFECIERRCEPLGPLVCPSDMVPVADEFCIDRYEASRLDATASSVGTDTSIATSREGVLPWQITSNQEGQSACLAAGKSLCTEEEWYQACVGPEGTAYAYGDEYSPTICNGIEKYCYCGAGSSCADRDPCPFTGCYYVCSASLKADPTGSNAGCRNDYGVYDINGNVWEHVLGGSALTVRGGAFNCSDSERFHRCDYIPGNWTPSALGFRCCSPGLTVEPDGGPAGGDPGPGGAAPGDGGGGD